MSMARVLLLPKQLNMMTLSASSVRFIDPVCPVVYGLDQTVSRVPQVLSSSRLSAGLVFDVWSNVKVRFACYVELVPPLATAAAAARTKQSMRGGRVGGAAAVGLYSRSRSSL